MYPEFMNAEYLQKRKRRFQWLRNAVVFISVSALLATISALTYLTLTE